ncbi:MAG: enoyl-CoA hydratase/isomerase family protein [Gammaproteobacteria bacterium]|nr:enoyl-CoA hydratase/isomerase family protein [Gammaproteobacteria bacterium]
MDDSHIDLRSPVLFGTLTADNGRRIGMITLNAEKTLNALSLDMIDLITEQLEAWATDEDLAIVILQAAGDKAFCAGGDLQNLYQSMLIHHDSPEKDDIRANPYARDFFDREYRLDYFIHTYPKPILCWGHGIVMGGGIGLMAGASHRVVTEKSRLAMPEIAIGLFPDVGGSYFLNRMPGKLGLFLALTGAMINTADAKFAQLADYAIAQVDKSKVLDELLRQPWGTTHDENSQLLDIVLRRSEIKLEVVQGPLQVHFEAINELCNKNDLTQVVQAIITLDPEEAWLKKAVAALKAGSPSSAHLANLLLNQTVNLPLADVFRLEYIAALHCAARPDFAEGIRALLIDKDLKPEWQPATHAKITPKWVNGFIESPWSIEGHPLADLGIGKSH